MWPSPGLAGDASWSASGDNGVEGGVEGAGAGKNELESSTATSAESGGAAMGACPSPPEGAEAGAGGPSPKTAATTSSKVGGADAPPSNEHDIEEDSEKPRVERMAAEGSSDAKPPSTRAQSAADTKSESLIDAEVATPRDAK